MGILALLAACGASSSTPAPTLTPRPTPTPPSGDGEILERMPCPVPADADAFATEIDAYLRADIVQAGLEAELAARPPSSLFPRADHARLVSAAADGRCQRIVYRSDGLRVVGFIVRPPDAGAAPRPVVVWLRGGNRELGHIGTFALVHMLDLADAGFVVLATQYRGVDGGEGSDGFGGDEVDDVLALAPLARALPGVDADRMFLFGGSRGAMEGLLALRRGFPARAAAFRGGLYDLHATLQDRPDLATIWAELIVGWDTDRERVLDERSPQRWSDEIDLPVLLLHGRQDWRASLAQAEAFAAALTADGNSPELVVYEREEHQLAFHRAEWIARLVAWFRTHGAFDARD